MRNAIDASEVRAQLVRRRTELEQRSARARHDVRHQAVPLSADAPDRAVEVANDRVLEDIEAAAADELRLIDEALRRLGEGRYGQCRMCNSNIPKRRLTAVPYATVCVRCANNESVVAS